MDDFVRYLLENANYKNPDGSYNKLRHTNEKVEVENTEGNGVQADNINELLNLALERGASDIHIVVGAPPKHRINGDLVAMKGYSVLTAEDTERLLSAILTEEQLECFESDGDLDFAYAIPNIGRFRVNLYKQRGTYSGVFRALSGTIPTVEQLRIPASIVDLVNKKRGLILVTGPTGSGKSTTLASLLNEINRKYHKNIITLEDPIEYLHKHQLSNVSQREMGVDSKSFASALRAALREDPDVILVGEMRDFETISTAITAAETGHLVFSTLHTIGAASTIDRIVDTYPVKQQTQARSQLANVIEGVISQQLVPTSNGKGRVAAFEIMLGTPAIRNLIRESKTELIAGTIQTSGKMGMQLLDSNLAKLVREGVITSDRAVEFAVDKKGIVDLMRKY
jgi:twitching motility protein PilT